MTDFIVKCALVKLNRKSILVTDFRIATVVLVLITTVVLVLIITVVFLVSIRRPHMQQTI